MSAIKIIQALGRKIAAKKSKTSEGITQIQPQIYAESEASNIAQRLVDAGLPMERFDEFIFSEADVVRLLNQIKALEKKNLAENIRSGIRNTESAKVFDLKGKRIKDTDNIMGGEEMPPPGSRGGKDDIAAPVQSSEETLKNMIMAENKKNIAAMKRRKMLDEAIDNVSPSLSGDRKVDADIVAEDLAERMGLVYDDMPTKERLKLYDEAYQALTKKKFDPPEDLATGGRVGFFMGSKFPKGLATLREMLKFFGRGKEKERTGSEILKLVNPKQFNKLLEDPNIYRKFDVQQGIGAPELIKNMQADLAKNRTMMVEEILGAAKNLRKADISTMERKNEIVKEMIERGIDRETAGEMADTILRMAEATAGMRSTPKLTDEGILELENILKNMETGGKDKRSLNADGGRIGLKDGMNRRTFLKLLGGLASIPIIGKIVKPLKTVKGVKNVPIIKTDNVPGKPEWFDQLVNKVIIEGDDVTKQLATVEREIVHTKKINNTDEVTVYQDLNTNSVRVEYKSPDNMMEETVDLSYKRTPPDEGSPKGSAEFEASEMGFVGRADGPDDYFIDAEPVGGQSIKDLDSDVSALKEYATGKGPTMKEIVQKKKRKDKVKKLNEGDLDAQSDYITARQGDYYDYDDYASGGIARMLGE